MGLTDPAPGVVVDLSVPEGRPGHERFVEVSEGERARRRATAEQTARAERAHLRIARNAALAATDWVELPSAADRLTPDRIREAFEYRQALRDLNIDALPDLPETPGWLN